MTIQQTLKTIRESYPTLTARYISETKEFRITSKNGTNEEKENRAYYTNDREDALSTAKYMHSEWKVENY